MWRTSHIGKLRNLAWVYKELGYSTHCQLFSGGTSTSFLVSMPSFFSLVMLNCRMCSISPNYIWCVRLEISPHLMGHVRMWRPIGKLRSLGQLRSWPANPSPPHTHKTGPHYWMCKPKFTCNITSYLVWTTKLLKHKGNMEKLMFSNDQLLIHVFY